MNGFQIVRRLKARRSAILEHLPPHLLTEFEEIEAAIRQIDLLLQKEGQNVDVPIPTRFAGLVDDDTRAKETRTPLAQRRQTLYDFLSRRGPATRAEILAGTDIPQGTLSALLSDEMFVKVEENKWAARRPTS